MAVRATNKTWRISIVLIICFIQSCSSQGGPDNPPGGGGPDDPGTPPGSGGPDDPPDGPGDGGAGPPDNPTDGGDDDDSDIQRSALSDTCRPEVRDVLIPFNQCTCVAKFILECDGAAYDPLEKFCCGGKLFSLSRRKESYVDSCCDVTPYNSQTCMCCKGNVVPRIDWVGSEYKCCGSQGYLPRVEVCCDEKIVRQCADRIGCCNRTVYHKHKEVCCDGTILKRKVSHECCGEKLMNLKTHVCCHKIPLTRPTLVDKNIPNIVACCGLVPYFTFDRKINCCGQRIIPAIGYVKCCKHPQLSLLSRYYDNRKHVCCENGELHKMQNGQNKCCLKYDVDPITKEKTLLSFKLHSSRFICCQGDLLLAKHGEHSRCCGLMVFDATNQICCGGAVSSVVDPDSHKCCGVKAYDPTSKMCCEKSLLHVNETDPNNRCCGCEVYDQKKEICCERTVLPIENKKTACCMDTPYDPHSSLCCYGRIHYGMHLDCCGASTVYDANKLVCCNRVMGSVYDPKFQGCCDGTVIKFMPLEGDQTYSTEECCGGWPFIAALEICCCGHIYHREESPLSNGQNFTACCGGKPFNANDNFCCGDDILPKTDLHNNCCDDLTPYNDRKQLCYLVGEVMDKDAIGEEIPFR